MAQRVSVASATKGLHPHRYQPYFINSLDFGDLDTSLCVEVVPSDNFKSVHGGGIIRLAPQVFPPFGKAQLKHATFFVPEVQLIEYSDALHQRMTTYKGEAIQMPFISAAELLNFFTTAELSTTVKSLKPGDDLDDSDFPDRDDYDFIYPLAVSGGVCQMDFKKLTLLGAKYYKTLKQLGYDFPTPIWNRTAATVNAALDAIHFTALPLLAYCKVYVDMFLNGVQYNSNNLVYLLKCIHDNQDCNISGTTYYSAYSGRIHATCLLNIIFDNILLPFEQNMYTSAWNSFNSPDGVSPQIDSAHPSNLLSPVLPTESSLSDTLATSSTANSLSNHTFVAFSGLTAAGIRMLDSFDKFVRRWNLAGTKAAQRIYAMFGIKSDDFKSNYVHKLSEGSVLFQFHPVLSNADTKDTDSGKGQYLGDYAGFAQQSLDINFSYKSSSYGYLITVCWLQITPIMYHGCSPQVLRLNGLDFYTPEYDGKSMRAIPMIEVSRRGYYTQSATISQNNDNDIFGFVNTYDDYRNMRDVVSGDMLKKNYRKYFFGRDISILRDGGYTFKPQMDDVQYYGHLSAYGLTDPFQYDRSNGDRFWMAIEWDIEAERPILSDSSALDLGGEGPVQFDKNGKMMS